MMEPKFTHDCNECVFLGHEDNHDLYWCGESIPFNWTVIARYGDGGPDYTSGAVFAKEGEGGIPLLFRAKQLAIEKGLIEES